MIECQISTILGFHEGLWKSILWSQEVTNTRTFWVIANLSRCFAPRSVMFYRCVGLGTKSHLNIPDICLVQIHPRKRIVNYSFSCSFLYSFDSNNNVEADATCMLMLFVLEYVTDSLRFFFYVLFYVIS